MLVALRTRGFPRVMAYGVLPSFFAECSGLAAAAWRCSFLLIARIRNGTPRLLIRRVVTGLRASLICAAVAFAFIASCFPASAQTLEEQVKKLTEALEKLNTVEGEAARLIVKLRGELDKVNCADVVCKLALLQQFRAAIGSKIVAADTISLVQLEQILLSIGELAELGVKHHPDLTIQRLAEVIHQKFGTTDSAKEAAAIDGAITVLQAQQDPVRRAQLRAHELKLLIPTLQTIPKELNDELDELAAVIRAKDPRKGPFLNIVSAVYGDLHVARKYFAGRGQLDPATGAGRRICGASPEVRSACQGRPSCPFDPTTTPTVPNVAKLEVTGARLCGEDPVPHAGNSVAGLVVSYQCVSLRPDQWRELENNPRALSGKVHQAVLRGGSGGLIRCKSAAE